MPEVYTQGDPPPPKPRLKPLPRVRYKTFSKARLYLDDLEAIEGVLRTTAREPGYLWMRTNTDEVPTVSLLADQDHDLVPELHFSVTQPEISVELSRRKAWVRIARDDQASLYAFDQIIRILEASRPPLGWRLRHSVLPVYVVTLVPFALVSEWLSNAYSPSFAWLRGIILGITWGILVNLLPRWLGWNRTAWLIPKYRRDARSFRQRSSHELKLGVLTGSISAIVGAVISALITIVLFKMGVLVP